MMKGSGDGLKEGREGNRPLGWLRLGVYGSIIGSSCLIGLAVGLSTVGFVRLYTYIWGNFTSTYEVRRYIVLMPVLGLSVAYLLVKGLAEVKTTGCGTHELLELYHYGEGFIPERDTLVKPIASAITIGLGGSAGLEGPSLLLGGGVASAICRRLGVSHEDLRKYLLTGAAAGISAVFKAPLTGILYAIEIPYQRDLVREAFIPATFSSLVAYLISIGMLGSETIFPMVPYPTPPSYWTAFHALILGLITAGCGVVFTALFRFMKRLASVGPVRILNPITGGLLLGLIGWFYPQTLGLGYDTIGELLHGEDLPLGLLVSLIVFKMIATSITLSSGGSGGLFVPSIFVGSALGAAYAGGVMGVQDKIIVTAAIAALISSTSKTLFASIAFVAETSGPSSIIPSLISATTAYFASGRSTFLSDVQPVHRMVEEEEAVEVLYHNLKERGRVDTLKELKVAQVMTTNPVFLLEGMILDEAVNIMKYHNYRVYPVVTESMALIGCIEIEDVLKIPEYKRRLTLNSMPLRSPIMVKEDESIGKVMDLMIEYRADHVYVVRDLDGRELRGVIAGMDILKKLI
ncbi:chloride channel protein [Candidatus Bathyarchaeota archaeon]|nr:chloride channel protein [Candidatus Bathyarchaeota archaeon]